MCLKEFTHNFGLDLHRTKNGGLNGGLNPTEESILSEILLEPKITKSEIAAKTGKSLRTVERHLAVLIEKGYVIRQGSRKSGQWKVIK